MPQWYVFFLEGTIMLGSLDWGLTIASTHWMLSAQISLCGRLEKDLQLQGDSVDCVIHAHDRNIHTVGLNGIFGASSCNGDISTHSILYFFSQLVILIMNLLLLTFHYIY